MSGVKTKKPLHGPSAGRKLPQKQSDKEIYDKLNQASQQNSGIGRPQGPSGAPYDSTGAPTSESGQIFPAHLTHSDPYDETFAMKQALIGKDGNGMTPFGQAQLTADDMQAIERKAAMLQASHRLQWVLQNYNMNDPYQRKKLHEMMPEIKQDQLSIIDQRCEMAKRLAHMRLNGEPQSAEDLDLLYHLAVGAIKPPQGNLWDPNSWKDVEFGANDADSINRGVFSTNRMFSGGKAAARYNPIDPIQAYLGGTNLTDPRNAAPKQSVPNFSNGYRGLASGGGASLGRLAL